MKDFRDVYRDHKADALRKGLREEVAHEAALFAVCLHGKSMARNTPAGTPAPSERAVEAALQVLLAELPVILRQDEAQIAHWQGVVRAIRAALPSGAPVCPHVRQSAEGTAYCSLAESGGAPEGVREITGEVRAAHHEAINACPHVVEGEVVCRACSDAALDALTVDWDKFADALLSVREITGEMMAEAIKVYSETLLAAPGDSDIQAVAVDCAKAAAAYLTTRLSQRKEGT